MKKLLACVLTLSLLLGLGVPALATEAEAPDAETSSSESSTLDILMIVGMVLGGLIIILPVAAPISMFGLLFLLGYMILEGLVILISAPFLLLVDLFSWDY